MSNAPPQPDLFPQSPALPEGLVFRPGLLDGREQSALAAAVAEIARTAPFRHPRMKGKGVFSAAITNCGTVGWWSDETGYRYLAAQPDRAGPWPPIPEAFRRAVARAVTGTRWEEFAPDACLINFYGPAAKMGLHQDKDEADFIQPIVTLCLGDAADWLIGGPARTDKATAFRVNSGDALVMGPPARMLFHGVRRIHAGTSPIPGLAGRYSLTFRKAL